MDIDLLLDSATPAETTVSLCLNGKLRAQYDALKSRIEERIAEEEDANSDDNPDARLTTRKRKAAPTKQEQADLDRLAQEMKAHTAEFRLVALPRPEFAKLVAEHPARTDPKTGRPIERFNAETLLPVVLRKALVEPVLSAAQYDKLLSKINEAQYAKLETAAWNINYEGSDLPF